MCYWKTGGSDCNIILRVFLVVFVPYPKVGAGTEFQPFMLGGGIWCHLIIQKLLERKAMNYFSMKNVPLAFALSLLFSLAAIISCQDCSIITADFHLYLKSMLELLIIISPIKCWIYLSTNRFYFNLAFKTWIVCHAYVNYSPCIGSHMQKNWSDKFIC